MDNIQILDNHHETLYYWRQNDFRDQTVIHIDSHHDLYDNEAFPWIDNYLWFAIRESIIKTLYLVYPRHVLRNADFFHKHISSIKGFKNIVQIHKELFKIITDEKGAEIYVCSLDYVFQLEGIILDIDLDYFIYNCLGCIFSKESDFLVSDYITEDIQKLIKYKGKSKFISISKSIYKAYTPSEYIFLYKLILRFLSSEYIDEPCRLLLKSLACNSSVIEFDYNLPSTLFDDIAYYNACKAIHRKDNDMAKSFYDKINDANKLMFQMYPTSCEYYLYKENIEFAHRETNKHNFLYGNKLNYYLSKAYIEYYQNHFSQAINYLAQLDSRENLKVCILLAESYIHQGNQDEALAYINYTIANLAPILCNVNYENRLMTPNEYCKHRILKRAIQLLRHIKLS